MILSGKKTKKEATETRPITTNPKNINTFSINLFEKKTIQTYSTYQFNYLDEVLYLNFQQIEHVLKFSISKLTILWPKLFTGKSLVPGCNTLAYRKGN